MNSNPFNKNLQDVTDPSDWHNTKLPNLSELDSLQRCYICKEFLKAPVMTSCNHTFCSHCIREYLIANNYCPLCKTEQFESNLKRNILLEEIVSCYANYRPLLLVLLKKESTSSATNNSSPQLEIANDETHDSRKRNTQNDDIIEVLSDDSTVISKESPRKKVKTEISVLERNAIPSRDEMVECPICSEIMSAEVLQTRHIDDCLSGKRTTSSRSPGLASLKYQSKKKTQSRDGITSFFKPVDKKRPDIPSSPVSSTISITSGDHQHFYFNEVSKHNTDVRKLPKLDFASLTTPKLKEKLSSLKLPTQGTRLQLELRYNHYYVLYNSNLDSNRPISDKVLKQRLNQWEMSHSTFNNSTVSSNLFNSGKSLSNKSITDKDFSAREWLHTYKNEFKQLVKTAKRSVRKSEQKSTDTLDDLKNHVLETSESESLIASDDNNANNIQGMEVTITDHTNDDQTLNFDIKQAIANSPLFINESYDQ